MRPILGGIAILILCSIGVVGAAHAQTEWYTYRHDPSRTGSQPYASDLSDPAKVANLSVQKSFPTDGNPAKGAFRASPIIVKDTVFIGSSDGYFYALDGASLAPKWQFPKIGDRPLLGSCVHGGNGSWGAYGIYSSASYATIGGQDAVIFGAPDPDSNTDGGAGSARLVALDFSGRPIWKSDVVAHVDCTPGSTLHERIAYSSPLVVGDKVYVGVHDAGDDPIQNGKVVAVDVNTGHIDNNFHYVSTGTRGGGVWNSPATDDGAGVYFTTGNTRTWNGGSQSEPNPNHGLSMIRVDKDTGNIVWAFQPVPFKLDDDPDWAAGATVMNTSCGKLIASVQKDGWSYAIDAARGPSCPLSGNSWQFPPTTNGCQFTKFTHSDDGYKQPGAAWNDVFIVKTGGDGLVDDGATAGYAKLHALNACATTKNDRVRWIAEIKDSTVTRFNSLGAPTVTGGIVFVGTDKGHLIVLGDPSVVAPDGWWCSHPSHSTMSDCVSAGYAWVPKPHVFRNIPMPDFGDIAGLRNEPALANGRVYVATLSGHVYMLDGFAPPAIGAVQPKYLRCGDATTPVKIAGTNFNDIQDVSLRDTSGVTTQVGFDPDSSVQLTAHIPNTISAGRYDLIVHTAHGSSNSSQFFVTPTVDRISPMSGPATGGDEVTVNGTCFHRDTSVYFGSIQANTLAGQGCESSSQCKVFSPAAATASPVDVVASYEGASSANTPPNPQFAYTGPNIAGFSPKSGPISGGTPVEITGSGFPAYDGINPLNMQVLFGDVQTMAECFVTDCDVVTPKAMHPGQVHIIAKAFGASSTSADLFTYNQYPALTKFLVPGPPNSGDGAVYLDGNAPDDGALIQLMSSDPSAVSLQPTATVPPASYWTSVPVTFLPTSKTEMVTLTATYQGSSVRATVNVVTWPPLSITLGADQLGIGESTTASVALNPSPAADAIVVVSSSDPSAVSVLPMNVKVPGGSYIGTFTVTRGTRRSSGGRNTVTITAAYGDASASADLGLLDDCTRCGTPQKCCVCNGGVWDRGRCE